MKNEAESILAQLGIPVSVVINSLYRQIIYHRGIPFSMTVPPIPKALDAMTAEEFNDNLRHSYERSLAGQGRPFEEVFDALERDIRGDQCQ